MSVQKESNVQANESLLERLFEPLSVDEPKGAYRPQSQTWAHRDWLQFSPVKHNQEM